MTPSKRGPKPPPSNPLATELASARRDNIRLQQRLERAEAIIELQKKLPNSWGSPQWRATQSPDGGRRCSDAERPERCCLCRARDFTRQRSSSPCPRDAAVCTFTAAAKAEASPDHRTTAGGARPVARAALRRPRSGGNLRQPA
jgi:hypothetical protein